MPGGGDLKEKKREKKRPRCMKMIEARGRGRRWKAESSSLEDLQYRLCLMTSRYEERCDDVEDEDDDGGTVECRSREDSGVIFWYLLHSAHRLDKVIDCICS